MHIASPNAGEVIQGFALALKKGIVYDVSPSCLFIYVNFLGDEWYFDAETCYKYGATLAKRCRYFHTYLILTFFLFSLFPGPDQHGWHSPHRG